jgi:hypothetical protein
MPLEGYKSHYAKRNKGLISNKPNFLDYNGHYVLPYYAQSRVEVKINGIKYYRLPVGKYIANNYRDIVDNKKYVCLNMQEKTVNTKKYIDQQFLKPVPPGVFLPKSKNYIVDGSYIEKTSPNIIDAGYIYIKKPPTIKNRLKLIEIVPHYEGTHFKINFSYGLKKTNNQPMENNLISIDLGMANLLTIYDPTGSQWIVKGSYIKNLNKYYNNQINYHKSILAKANKRKYKKNSLEQKWNRLKADIDIIDGTNNKYVPMLGLHPMGKLIFAIKNN